MLAQPGKHKLDHLIYFASRQLNDAERNYTTTEQEGLSMVYVVKKFRHYLLVNKFVFFVDHQALLYLVNKPCMTGRISQEGEDARSRRPHVANPQWRETDGCGR